MKLIMDRKKMRYIFLKNNLSLSFILNYKNTILIFIYMHKLIYINKNK